MNHPVKNISVYVEQLAKRHGVSGLRTPDDELADVITRLSGDEVVTDTTEDLIVALKRAKVINGSEMVELLGGHLDEMHV